MHEETVTLQPLSVASFPYLYSCKSAKDSVVITQMSSAGRLTFKEVYGLEHVGLNHSIVFRSFEEQGDLLHLLKRHSGGLDGPDGLVGSAQAVDELTQHLEAHTRRRLFC